MEPEPNKSIRATVLDAVLEDYRLRTLFSLSVRFWDEVGTIILPKDLRFFR